MEHLHHRGHFDKRVVLGGILIIIGLVFLGRNLGWFDERFSDIIISWPMLLIVLGFFSLLRKSNNAGGWIMIAIGVYFLLPDIIPTPYDNRRYFWPVLLVIIGLVFIFKKRRHPFDQFNFCTTEEYSTDLIDEVNIFGGSEKKITTKNFKGGKITSIFGGSNYDMLDSELAEGRNVLDMVNIFGGSKLIVPNDWNIHVDVVSVFGGFADKRRNFTESSSSESPKKELIITGVAIFGGGEIKSI